MAYQEFSGELDKPTGFVEFSGELDKATAEPVEVKAEKFVSPIDQLKQETLGGIKSWSERGTPKAPEMPPAGAGRGNVNPQTIAQREAAGGGRGFVNPPTVAQINKENQGVFSRAAEGIGTGFEEAEEALGLTGWAMAGGDTTSLAKSMAASMAAPQVKTRGEQEIDAAFKRVSDATGFLNTAKAGFQALATSATNPTDALMEAVRSTPSSLPTLGGGLVGGVAGLPAGVPGAIVGAKTGMAAGTTAIELGSEVRDMVGKKLAEKNQQPTEENIKAILDDEEFRTAATKQGLAKGLTVAAVDNLFMGIGGKIATMPAKSAIGRAGAGAAALAVDTAGESIGEGASQQVARGSVDYGEALREGVASLGQSVTTTAAGAAFERAKQGVSAPVEPEVSTAEAMARERGFLTPERPAVQMTNFTPADSPTKAAGLVDVVVPVPATPAVTPLAEVQVNPATEQQFGLDKLRLGTTNVGVPSTTGTTNVPSGAGGGIETVGGVGATGLGVAGPTGGVAAATTPTQLGGEQVAATGAATGQQPTALKQEWYGRRGDGYVTKPDAEQALVGRQRMFPDLQWQVETLPTGKFRLAGYEAAAPEAAQAVVGEKINKEWTAFSPESGSLGIPRAEMPQVKSENRGAMVNFLNARGITSEKDTVEPSTLKPTQAEFSPEKVEMAKENRGTDRAILVSSDGRVIDGHHQWMAKLESGEPVNVIRLDAPATELIGAIKEFPSSTTAEGATLGTQTPQAIQAAQEEQQAPTAAAELKPASTASMRVINSVRKSLIKENVEIAALPQAEMSEPQKVASAVANMLGKTLTVVRYESGDRSAMPNGFADSLGGNNLFVAEDSEDAPLFVTMHEAYHTLPAETRTKLNTALNSLFKEDMRSEFVREFNYTEDKLEEEIPAFMVQAISKRADFWEQLRAKMGNKDFAEVAKHILSKLNEILSGSRKEYGEDFVSKYIKDVEKARDLLTTAYAEAINNKEVAAEAERVVPLSGPVSKDEAIINGVMYSARSRDLVKLPTIDFKDLVGKRVFGIKADLTDAGVSYTGIDGSQLEFPVEMMGGPNFVALPANVKSNVVWAVRGGATLTKIMNVVNDSDYIMVHAMNSNSHLTNATISQAYIQTVESYLKDKRISKKNLLALDKIVRSPANKNSLPDFPGFESPNIIDYIDGLSFDQRGALAKMLEKKEAQAHGLPNLDRFRRETIDPEYAGYRQGDAMLVIEVDKKNPTVKLGEEGTKMHPSYPLGLRGKVVGKLSKGINYELIYRDYFEKKVPTLGNKEAGAWYTFDRVMPVQEITPEIASSVSEGGYKAIKSARQAEASLALANDNWLVSGKTKAEGGVSVQEFVDALAANEGAAALTMYTPEDVKAGIKDKSFSVYQLGKQGGDKGLQVFFGLKRGAPWYKDMIDGVSDNEVEVVSVTNNETGAPGIGIPAIITKAIQEGATILDAFAVKSKRFPDGFLPEMYSQFGFETIGSVPFDSSFYDANQMADLKKFWADGGWKESDGYPDVVVMKWKGNDDERATSIERYVREGQTSVSVGSARFNGSTTEAAHGQRNQPRAKQGRGRGANAGQAGGDQGAGNAAPVVRRAYDSIQELATLSDGDIRNLGLDPAEVAKLKQSLGGVQLSKRAGSPEPIGRSSIGRDQGDAVKVEGAIHYGRSAGLSVLSGTSFGSGIKGAEQQRLAQPGVDPRIKRRVYFYLPVAGGIPQAEIGLGANVYTANLSNLYDPSSGSLKLPTDANGFESGVLDAGFRGYINRAQGTAVVLNSDVPVKAVGRAEAQTIVKRAPQVAAQKISTREEGNELVRKPTEREMIDIIKVRPELVSKAPSFKLEYGSARVATAEAPAANAVFEKAGSTFMFSKRVQTETPEFKKWFKDSKVVNADGSPKVMYHGTTKDFNVFDLSQSPDTSMTAIGAIFVTDDPKFANDFTYSAGTGPLSGNIMPVYVRAENPFDFDNASHRAEVIDDVIDQTPIYANAPNRESMRRVLDESIEKKDGTANWGTIENETFLNVLKDHGFDSFYVREGGRKNLGLFDNKQIKSATGNIGTFDETNPDIRYSKRSIGQALQDRVDNDFDALVQEYNAIKGTDGGRILDADLARELSPEYRANKTRAAEVHSAVSAFIEKLFKQRVIAARNTGGLVALKAGGGGAGKSSADSFAAGPLRNAHTIWDGTLSTPAKADAAVKLALDNNQAVAVVYIYRDPVEALANREGGVLARAMSTRRVVPIYSLVKTHVGSSQTVRMLDDKYGSDPRFGLVVVDNSRGKGLATESSLQNITPVIQSGLKEKLLNETEQAYADGFIDREIYERTIEAPVGQGAATEVSANLGENGEGVERGAEGRRGSQESRDTLTQLFADLRESRGLKLARVQERVENNPLSAAIKNVEENFYDIIGQLEEDGLIKINCK